LARGVNRRTTAVSVKVSEDDLKKIEFIKRVLPEIFSMRSDFIKKVVPLMLYSLHNRGMITDSQIPDDFINQGKAIAEEIANTLGIDVNELVGLLVSNFSGAA